MSQYKSEFLRTLEERGFIKQITHPGALDEYCKTSVPVGYIGYDATADSLHVGHLVQIMMLRHLQKAGGKPIVLIGGGTTKVGDPTDKEKQRPVLTDAQIAANMAGIKKAFEPFLTFGDGPNDAIMRNNDDWLGQVGYLNLLREIGVHFTVNTMVKQETVARRLTNEQPYTFLEFNYLIMQSYDFLELFRREGCRLQLGGSDQWGNIVGGVDLIHKAEGGEAFGLTAHLITTASGAKMGKTMDGAVWLNADRKSPYEYWQFWRNTEDADVGRFLRLFTDLSLSEIEALEALEGAEINTAKIALANATTTLLHGERAAKEAERAASAVFGGGSVDEALPTTDVPLADIQAGLLTAAAFTAAGLTQSNGDARRLIKQGAAKVNDATVSDQNAVLTGADISNDGVIKLSAGKKRHALIKPV
ncbi:tyrosine--tRNA ligase [Henriciella pelagia]|jgi:tyrosyl-tRNA synthetase|uniref:Tyrosine--tRNA ligase n=1 Tax=Henriciella pelagia TaxID=1977912 RepID=A0ABQ1J6T0_9PROT|nr:tyrosine--tRNA ligase [Henriciella pelagia]GGB59369.1 tyrosine--tRNA ligase [Henriciella pelagia]